MGHVRLTAFILKYPVYIASFTVIVVSILGVLWYRQFLSEKIGTPVEYTENETIVSIQSDIEVAATGDCTVSSEDLTQNSLEKQVFDEINSYRASKNLGQLQDLDSLRKAASWMSTDMANTGNFAHTDSTGRDFTQRLKDCGNTGGMGEIIQRNPSTSAVTLVTNWKNSPGHNAIMIKDSYKYMGVAQKGSYWTVDFVDRVGTQTTQPTVKPTITTTQPTVTKVPTSVPKPSVTPEVYPTSIPTGTVGTLTVVTFVTGTESSASAHVSFPVTVTIQDVQNNQIASERVALAYDQQQKRYIGAVRLPASLQAGNYQVKIKGVHTLRAQVQPMITTINPSISTVLPELQLIAGDINNDNQITLLDHNALISCLPTSSCSGVVYDLNLDGKVDVVDYNVLLYSFKNVGGD